MLGDEFDRQIRANPPVPTGIADQVSFMLRLREHQVMAIPDRMKDRVLEELASGTDMEVGETKSATEGQTANNSLNVDRTTIEHGNLIQVQGDGAQIKIEISKGDLWS